MHFEKLSYSIFYYDFDKSKMYLTIVLNIETWILNKWKSFLFHEKKYLYYLKFIVYEIW